MTQNRFLRRAMLNISSLASSPPFELYIALLWFIESSAAIRWFIFDVVSLAVVVLIRSIYFRARPRPRGWTQSYLLRLDASSFPSLHSMRAASAAVLLWGFGPGVGAVAMLTAAVICYSRWWLEDHHASDVLWGAAAGVALALGIVKLFSHLP